MVLESTWVTATGTVVLFDALATGPADDPHALGAAAPRLLVRVLECTAGEVEIAVEFAPRALVNAAWAIAQAEQTAAGDRPGRVS